MTNGKPIIESTKLDILMFPVGSAGDVHPHFGLGAELLRRGHHVTVATNAAFRDSAVEHGFEFIEAGSEREYRETLEHPDLWKPSPKATKLVMTMASKLIPIQYETIRDRCATGNTIVIASCISFGALIAQDKFGLPTATIELQPSMYQSIHAPPKLPGLWMPSWLPTPLKRAEWWLINRIVDRICKPVNEYRQQIGLPPVRDIMKDWWHGNNLILAMFPEWFAQPQPDWPKQVELCGFPLYDPGGEQPLTDEVKRFLDAGDPPIVWTPGSANHQAAAFFKAAVGASQQMGKRSIFLTRHGDQVPRDLPGTICHFDWVPLKALLPHCAGLVHHGGIGTTAQGVAGGVPQLIWALSHDQFDNADRLETLGIGKLLPPKRFTPDNIAALFGPLLESDSVNAKCQDLSTRARQGDALARAADLVEAM